MSHERSDQIRSDHITLFQPHQATMARHSCRPGQLGLQAGLKAAHEPKLWVHSLSSQAVSLNWTRLCGYSLPPA